MRDTEFIRGKIPMTKEEVRAVVLSKLDISETDHLLDVGAGTGSVSIEAALKAKKGTVIAIEHKTEATALIKENAQKFQLKNLSVIHGKAPDLLPELNQINKVFVGGSGGNLIKILDKISVESKAEIIVVSAIVVDTMMQAYNYFRAHSQYDTELVQVAVSKVETGKNPAMLLASNPIFIVTARKKTNHE